MDVSLASYHTEVDHEVVIVGAGFGGMGAAIQLRREGVEDIAILDREDDLGGTWHINTYPGIAVDIASVTYSYSFEPNPAWSRVYAPGAELKAYAEHVADTYDLRRLMQFSTSVTGVEWDDIGGRWLVRIADGEVRTCRMLVMATGFLSHPKLPDLPGLDDFAGTVMHTARWDHDHDLAGRRVGIVGTGATAVQVIPEIAPQVDHLDVFQRTPIWVTPKLDGPVPGVLRRLFGRLPVVQALARHTNNALLEALGAGVLYHRQAPFVVAAAEALARANLWMHIRDPDVRAALTPDYDFFCKRPTFSNSYYPAFRRPNVDLVTAGIERLDADGIVTTDGVHHPVDTLILATGFTLMEEGNYPPFPVVGRGGLELGAHWRSSRFSSYEGLTVHGFPNLLYMPSPYAYTGLSAFMGIETQMAHMHRLLGHMRREGLTTFEPTAQAETRFLDSMLTAAEHTVWASGSCATSNSYYFNEHGDTSLGRLAPTAVARWQTRRFPLEDYDFDRRRQPAAAVADSSNVATS